MLLEPRAVPAICVRWSSDGSRVAISLGDDSPESRRGDAGDLLGRSGRNARVSLRCDRPAGAIEWLDR